MKILIFTQDRELLNSLREDTKAVMLAGRQEAKVYSFPSMDMAFNELKADNSAFDLVVLDIDYIKNLKEIYTDFRAQNLLAALIIISGSYRQLDSAMLLRPTAYLKKPLAKSHYRSRLKFILNEFSSINSFFTFKQRQELGRIPYFEIEYFESNQRNVTLHLRNSQSYIFTAKLTDIEGKLPGSNFLRCHQSYLVNMDNVRILDKVNRQFHMISGKCVDISRRNLSEVSERFDIYISSMK